MFRPIAMLIVACSTLVACSTPDSAPGAVRPAAPAVSQVRQSTPRTRPPLSFEENRGQWSADVEFVARARGYSVVLADGGADLVPEDDGAAPVRLRFVDASPAPSATGVRPRTARSNYLLGGDRSAWRTGVRNFERVLIVSTRPICGIQAGLEFALIITLLCKFQIII